MTILISSVTGVSTSAAGSVAASASVAVVNHSGTLRGDGTVPVKLHCAAASSSRCEGNLLLVVDAYSGYKLHYEFAGRKTKTYHLQASGVELEIFLQSGGRDATVRVKETSPHRVAPHSATIAVVVPG